MMKKVLIGLLLILMVVPFAFAKRTTEDHFDSFYIFIKYGFDKGNFSFENAEAGFFAGFKKLAAKEALNNFKLMLGYNYSNSENPVFNGPKVGLTYKIKKESTDIFDFNAKIQFSNDFFNFHINGFDFSVQKTNVDFGYKFSSITTVDEVKLATDVNLLDKNKNEKIGYFFELGYFYSLDRNYLNSGLHFDGRYQFSKGLNLYSSGKVHFTSKDVKLEDFAISLQYEFTKSKDLTKIASFSLEYYWGYEYSYDNAPMLNGFTFKFDSDWVFKTLKTSISDNVLKQLVNNTTFRLVSGIEAGVYGCSGDYKFNLNKASISLNSELDAGNPIENDNEKGITGKNFGAIKSGIGINYCNSLESLPEEKGLFLTFAFNPGITAEHDTCWVDFSWNLENYKFTNFTAEGQLGYKVEELDDK